MKPLQQYRIPFTGLAVGKHLFEYVIDASFFAEFTYSMIKEGRLVVKIVLEKKDRHLVLQFDISGEIKLLCDVCLANYPSQVEIKEQLIVQLGKDAESDQDAEDIIFLTNKDYEIDVSSPIYEYINLTVPYISRCEDEGNNACCDQEMIARIKKLAVKQNKKKAVDPRWNALKNLSID